MGGKKLLIRVVSLRETLIDPEITGVSWVAIRIWASQVEELSVENLDRICRDSVCISVKLHVSMFIKDSTIAYYYFFLVTTGDFTFLTSVLENILRRKIQNL